MTAAKLAPPATYPTADPFVPHTKSVRTLARAAKRCRGCPLFERATQTVFGEGPAAALIMLVGEQPGDAEDRQGRPFVGPAGALLDRALQAAGIARDEVYLTNAVKHFSWEPRGKRRIHKKPRLSEMKACRPWLAAEVRAVAPQAIVCLGATAVHAVLGPAVAIGRARGRPIESPLGRVVVARHPSAVLRMATSEERERGLADLVDDLTLAVETARPGRSLRRSVVSRT